MRVPLLLSLLISASLPAPSTHAESVRVGVAISLKEAVSEVAVGYEKKTGEKVRCSFGSSGQIMAQIKAGAPIDAFISAADKQVDELALLKLVDPDTRRVVAGNALVLVVSRDSTARLDSFEGLARAAVKRLALGEPRTVPAGEYATQVLKTLKLTDALTGRLVYGSNVRQVLDYVARGEVTAGIVYATDARESGERVKVAATAKGEWHKPIVYPAVLVTKSGNAAAAGRFLEHLATPEAQAVLRRRGFAPAPDADAAAANEPADRRP